VALAKFLSVWRSRNAMVIAEGDYQCIGFSEISFPAATGPELTADQRKFQKGVDATVWIPDNSGRVCRNICGRNCCGVGGALQDPLSSYDEKGGSCPKCSKPSDAGAVVRRRQLITPFFW
jgi:hypothetical protein